MENKVGNDMNSSTSHKNAESSFPFAYFCFIHIEGEKKIKKEKQNVNWSNGIVVRDS